MFHYETVKILHHHGGDTWLPMDEVPEHDSASHDPERAWLRGARIFKCTTCDEQVAIADPAASSGLVSDPMGAPIDDPAPAPNRPDDPTLGRAG